MTHRWAVLLGALTVVAFLFRHDHGLYIGAGSLAAILFASWPDGTRALVRRAVVFAVAVAVCLLPWAVFVQYHVGLIDYLEPGLEFSRAEAEATVIRSLPPFDFGGGPVAMRTNLEVWLFYLFHAMPVVSLGIAWSRARRGRERWAGESAGVAAIAVMAIVMNFGFIRTPLAARLPDAGAPAAMLGAWLIGLAFDVRLLAARRMAIGAAAAIFLATALAVSVVADVPGNSIAPVC